MLPFIVYDPPVHILCGFVVEITTASPTTILKVSVHPQLSVTVTVYVPALNDEGSSDVDPLSHE